jgi:hypothetical protein
MTRALQTLAIGTALMLGACNQNTASGNDREVQVDSPSTAASISGAAEALSGVAPGGVMPETMNEADIASLGGYAGNCVIRLTGIGFPSFFEDRANGRGYLKLNGKLVGLDATGEDRYADGDLTVQLREAPSDESNNGLPGAEMIIALPQAEDELGFRGYKDCGTAGE